MSEELLRRPARELGALVRARETSAAELCSVFLERAAATEERVGAYLELDGELLLTEARAIDARLAEGESLSALGGVPVALKDNLCTRGRPTTCGSRLLADWRPPYDATVIQRLRGAGCVPFGKTNCDEFGMGSSTEHSALGRTRNPWNPERVPGGSSGGSAAAVAARSAPLSLGSDTGGSIRQPAAFCGIVGLKPTWGRVSRHGLVAYASSLDQVGPLARDVADAAALLELVAGADPADATCSRRELPELAAVIRGEPRERPFRFGLLHVGSAAGLADDVARVVAVAAEALERAGGERRDVTLALAGESVAAYYVIATAEASSNLARHDGVQLGRRAGAPTSVDDLIRRTREEGLGPEVQRRILLGTHVLSAGHAEAWYLQADRVRGLIANEIGSALTDCDVLVSPTAPTTAFRFGEKVGDPLAMYLSDVFTLPASLAGLPAISLPAGLGDDGLPVGVQLTAARFAEGPLLEIAARLERRLGFSAEPSLPEAA